MAPLIQLDSAAAEAIDGRHVRAVTFQAVRMAYVSDTLTATGLPAAGSRALVVGSGRGLVAAGLRELGFDVVAIDPSEAATALARQAYGRTGIDFRTAPAEDLGLADARFDLAYYEDTFEVTSQLDRVLAEAARAIRPGGVLVYDTVTRSLLSRLVYLGAFQAIPMTRIVPPGRYAAARLRTPAEMTAALARHGLRNAGIREFRPKDPRRLLTAVLARRRGEVGDAEIPSIVNLELASGDRVHVTYLGHAIAE
ncbi:class I SAM-dependent methyltransferase [Fodinicola acaciae]|uniref:class I SAM-dependent methyltransferase n=1 Tax=Fodinicola acaciae TaxID=2681555 RepID=UPI0013D86FCC|nr:class I SAM-dependent methyltransferase [Fodinicola acaciae]